MFCMRYKHVFFQHYWLHGESFPYNFRGGCFVPWTLGSSSMLKIVTHWGICVSSTHTFHLKDLKFAYSRLRIKETQQELVLS